jgi:hypothetical protein
MSWAIGYDTTWSRDIGYGVPATCDFPGCSAEIDRGLSYVCGGEPYGGDDGCGLYFCSAHLSYRGNKQQQCSRCINYRIPFAPTPDVVEWINHKLTDESWQRWRDESPAEVADLQARLAAFGDTPLRNGQTMDELAAAEREHFGDPDTQTGVYAPPDAA